MSIKEAGSFKHAQAGTGSVGTTAAQLVNVKDEPVFKGVLIKNTHASQSLFVARYDVSATVGYELGTNEEVFLEIDSPSEIYVLGSGASTTYTWIGY